MTPAERRSARPGEYRVALVALGRTASVESIRLVLSCLVGSPGWETVVDAGLRAAGTALVEPAVELWPSLQIYPRGFVVEILAATGVRDERIYQRLIEWLDVETFEAVLALGTYGDVRAVPHLQRVLDQAIDDAGDGMVAEIVESLDELGAGPTAEQARRLSARRRSPDPV